MAATKVSIGAHRAAEAQVHRRPISRTLDNYEAED
jgi:hypothetical protein